MMAKWVPPFVDSFSSAFQRKPLLQFTDQGGQDDKDDKILAHESS